MFSFLMSKFFFSSQSVACALEAGSCLCTYPNLTCLEVELEGSWQFVFDLLESSPNLEVLVCTKVSFGVFDNSKTDSLVFFFFF